MRKMKRIVAAIACLMPFSVVEAQQSPPAGYAMQFNGSNAYVRIEDNARLDLSRAGTFEMWVKCSSFAASDGTDLLAKGDGISDTDRAYEMALGNASSPHLGYYFFGTSVTNPVTQAAPVVGQWTHLALTIDVDAGSLRIFKNGQQVFEQIFASRTSIRNSTLPLYLGCRNTLCCGLGLRRFFHGAMDELRIWNIARTPAQIAATYNTTVPVNSPGLVAYYNFDEGSGATVLDRTGNGLHGAVNGGATWVQVVPPCTAPSVTTQPASQTACITSSVTFTTTIAGTTPSLQWRKNGANIQGATSATYTIASVSAADAGSYDCVATNSCGTATTSAAALNVLTPQILTPPTDQAVNVDQPVLFVVEPDTNSSCNAALQYQWQRRDPLVSDDNAPNAWISLQNGGGIVGATSPNLVILRPTPGLATGYRCRISGGCGCEFATSSVYYTATVNFSAACPSDFNLDGSVDGDDVITFFERWDSGC